MNQILFLIGEKVKGIASAVSPERYLILFNFIGRQFPLGIGTTLVIVSTTLVTISTTLVTIYGLIWYYARYYFGTTLVTIYGLIWYLSRYRLGTSPGIVFCVGGAV